MYEDIKAELDAKKKELTAREREVAALKSEVRQKTLAYRLLRGYKDYKPENERRRSPKSNPSPDS